MQILKEKSRAKSQITFDEDFAKAVGVNVEFYNLIFAIVIAIIIVLAMNLVGSLLISALVIFPSLSPTAFFHPVPFPARKLIWRTKK